LIAANELSWPSHGWTRGNYPRSVLGSTEDQTRWRQSGGQVSINQRTPT
jgi:hypothetical protein